MNSAPRFTGLREQFEIAARAMQPLLNRVVFSGRHAAALLEMDATTAHPRTVFASDSEVHVLSSMSLDRIATEMQRLGFRRTARTGRSDLWAVDERVVVNVQLVHGERTDTNPWLEFATLLTVPRMLGDGTTARVSSAPALLALEWDAHLHAGAHPLESPHVEEIVRLTDACATIERDIASSPSELRCFVATETTRLLADDCAPHAIRSALADAASLPEIAQRVLERLRRIAALA